MMRATPAVVLAVLIGCLALSGRPSGAGQDEAELRKRIAALEAGQQAILKELQEIKSLLQSRPPVPPAPGAAPTQPVAAQRPPAQPAVPAPPAIPNFDLDIAGSPAKGRADARLVMIEFSDFQCPFCGRYSRDTYPQLEKEYVDTGKLRYVFRHYPIEQLHPLALRASEAADCAAGQGKFWDMHARLFANQQALAETDLVAHARALGLGVAAFQQCMTSQSTSPRKVRQDQADGAKAGISGTPTFFIGTLTKEGKVKVMRRLVGAAPYTNFKTTLDALLTAPTP